MIDQGAAELIGTIIVEEVAKLPPLSGVAIVFQTGQSGPVVYFAYETAAHALARLNSFADTAITEIESRRVRLMSEGAQPDIDKLTSDLSAREYLHQQVIGDHCNGLLETGHWDNPASPVLYQVQPAIDAWADAAFAALLQEQTEDEWYVAYGDLTGTLWAALDHARRSAEAWPPIAFVASFDDTGGGLPKAIVGRHAHD